MIADVVSSDVVGYNTDTSASGFNFKSPSFLSVGYNTVDIQDVKVDDNGAGGIGFGTETIAVWQGLPEIVAGSMFTYYDPSMDPNGMATGYYWGDDAGAEASFSVAGGQGVVIDCGEDLNFTFAGEVPTEAITFTTASGFNFTGNAFPAPLDISKIQISDDNAGGIGFGTETIAIWEGLPEIVAGSMFTYFDPSMDPNGTATGYYWGDDSGAEVSYSIPAGQGVVIDCGADLTITIEPPYSL